MPHTHWNPHITVATMVQADNRFLLVEEASPYHPHLIFNQPAGHIEYGETLVEGAIRETLEETGYHVVITHLQGIYTYTPPQNLDCTYYRFCFAATVLRHDATRQLDTGIHQATWLTLEELEATGRARSPLVTQCIRDALAGQQYPLSILDEQHLLVTDK